MNNELKSPNELSEEDQLVILQARENLIDFEIATDPFYEPNWHHEETAKELEYIEKYGDALFKILILSVPPRHGKSRECSIDFPAWFLGRDPKREIITASYSADLALDFGGKTRDKVDSELFRLIFPGVSLRSDEKAKGKWATEQGGGYVSAGVGGAVTGKGAHVFIIDDPIKNAEEAQSEVMREKNWEWFKSTAFTRLHPKGVMIIIMTRWHLDDLVGRILADPELEPLTKVIEFPAIAKMDSEFRLKGQPLWPARYDKKALRDIKTVVGPYVWAALYQCSPVLTDKQEFKSEFYKYIDEQELESKQTANYLTVDTAVSKKTQADSTGFCDNSVDIENFWNIKAWRAKIGPEELVDTLFSLHVKRKYTKIGIEKTVFLDGLKPFLDSEQRKRNIFLPIVPLKHGGISKEIRIRSLIPRYSAGSIRHVTNRCDQLEEEQKTFPMGMTDDVLDATAYQDQIVSPPRKKFTVNKPTPKRRR